MEDRTKHLLDHNLIFSPYLASEDADTLDAIFRDKEEQLECMVTFVGVVTSANPSTSCRVPVAPYRQGFDCP
jgi:hypothetical protein